MVINKPLISIIINCFNGEKYLNEALLSVLNQSYNNWEVIFWNNKSTDSSANIYKSYKDKRFRYFHANEHTTLYKARNLAIEKSRGEFISFLDVDDLWDKRKLELQIHYFKNPDVRVVFSNLWMLKKNKEKKKLYIKKKLPRGNIYNELIKNYNVGILTVIIRKSFYLKLKKKFDDRFSIIGDFDLFLRLSKICMFESIQEPLAFYRLHGKNLSTLNKFKEIKEFEIWLKENTNNLSEFDNQNFQKNLNFRKFVNYKIEGRYKDCLNMFVDSKISILSIKNLTILLIPVILLKKILWYHQD